MAHVGVHHVRVRPEMRERVDFACWIDQTDWRRYLEQRGVDVPLAWGRDAFTKETHERQGDSLVAQRYTGTRTEVWPADGEHFLDRFWCRRAAEIIRQPRQRPLALFVCLWAPHPPLWLPEPYAGLFDPKRLELPANVGAVPEAEPPSRRRGVPAQLAEGVWPEHWRRVWAAHLGLVRLADDGLGEVLDALEATGQAERTIVVFTVDHGDLLGQHAMYQKMEMYEPAVRVPLVIRGPDIVPRRLATPVSHLDVVPTLLELLDLDGPDDLDGVSLAGALRGGAEPPDRPLFAQYSGNPTTGDIRRAVITRRHKYVYDPEDAPELYDLRADPLEMHNLAPDPAHADTLAALHAHCRAWHEAHGDWVSYRPRSL